MNLTRNITVSTTLFPCKNHTVTNRQRPIVEQGSLLFDMETKG